MTPCVALVVVAVSTVLHAGSPPQSEEPAPRLAEPTPPAVVDASSPDRAALIAHASERPARTNAALNLLGADPDFLAAQVRTHENEEVVLAILEVLRIRATAAPIGEDLIRAVLERSASGLNGVAEEARETLKTLDRASVDVVRPRLIAAIGGEDAELATAAIDVLARTGDLAVVEPLLGVLGRSGGSGKLASASSAALTELLGRRIGPDRAAWGEFWKECTGKTRDRILRDVLDEERGAHAEEIDRKEREIVRLKREADGEDAVRLIANLEHEIAGVRRFSAELLTRGFEDIDLQPVRPTVLARLNTGLEPPAVQAAFMLLLRRLDVRAQRTGPEAERDAVVVRAIGSNESEVVLAAVDVAVTFPVEPIREAALGALRKVRDRPLSAAARIALVEAAAHGKLNLTAGLDALRLILRQDESVDVRVAAVSTLGSLKIADAGPDLARALAKDPDWRVRRRAAGALRTVAGAAALEGLLPAMDDPRPEVRSEAVLAVAEVGDKGAADALLVRLAREDAPAVRGAVARALGSLGGESAIAPLAGLLTPSAPAENVPTPAEAQVRVEARDALVRIGGDDLARWGMISESTATTAPDVHALALRERVRLLDKAGGDEAVRIRARLEACTACFSIGEFDAVTTLAADVGDPPAGADLSPYAEIAAIDGRARLGAGEPADAIGALERALGYPNGSPARRFAWSVDLAEAHLGAAAPDQAKSALPAGPPPDGASPSDVQRRDDLRQRLDHPDGVPPAENPTG